MRYVIKGNLPIYHSRIFTREIESRFLEYAKDFTWWMEYIFNNSRNSPYEDEEDRPKGKVEAAPKEKKKEKVEEKPADINIDDI